MPRRLLLLALLARLHAELGLIAVESLHVPNSTPKRTCPEGQGLFEEICCDLCPKGKVVENGCTQTSASVKCKLCTEGEDYMDHQNLSPKCRRCSVCDTEHGMEVEENCTIYQNVKCRCRPDFFCRSEQCQHCDHCTKCEEGTIEECTQTKDAVCKSKRNLLGLFVLIPVVPLFACFLLLYWYLRNKKLKKDYSVCQQPNDEEHEMKEKFPDIDLSPYISDVATMMTKKQVMKLVRKLEIPNGIIDTVVENNANDTDELKIALLQTWYEQNGVRGAHEKLISNLRQLKLKTTADKIEQKLKQ